MLLRSLFILVRNQTWTRISIQLDSSLRTVLGSALYWFILRFDLSSFFGFISNVGNAWFEFSLQHRYYGKSNPFGSMQKSLQNASQRGYFNSGQALADYAEVIINLKKNLSADSSPVIVVGGSYGGRKSSVIYQLWKSMCVWIYIFTQKITMILLFSVLAAWFRLKYPHVALGALASSAPILYFDDITPQDGYYSLVTKDFRVLKQQCLVWFFAV